jgi:hypothetical protein
LQDRLFDSVSVARRLHLCFNHRFLALLLQSLSLKKSFPMASSLLKCSICPKRPSFSDISHLLTHVGSKGHLSHLHKLQVRSHQEIAAGHELAAYDRWYQQHGLGQLLSERMLQKESKKGNKRGRSTTQRQVKNDPDQKDTKSRIPAPASRYPAVRTRQLHHIRPAKKLRLPSIDDDSDDDSDYDESPTRQRGYARSCPS